MICAYNNWKKGVVMGIPTNIKTLLSGEVVEWARIEFKETWDPVASLKSVCAFANDLDNWGGGYIIIGIEEENGIPKIPIKGLEKSSIPGLFFFNTEAEITVNAYETDKDNVENYICDYLPEVELDADLSDWDLKKTLLKSETDASNGNKMNVYAYKNDSGVYLAYDVKHQYQPKVYMWNEGADERGVWYYNTNGEFWINDMHFACTTFGDSGYMMKAMKTTEDLKTGGYTTVIEAFIPNEVIQSNTAAIGFSFKTCDMSYGNANEITNNAMKFNGDPWWFFKGQFPTDMSSRFILE